MKPTRLRATVRAATLAMLVAVGAAVLLAQQPTFKAPAPRFADPGRHAKLARAFPEIDKIFQDSTSASHVPGAAWGRRH